MIYLEKANDNNCSPAFFLSTLLSRNGRKKTTCSEITLPNWFASIIYNTACGRFFPRQPNPGQIYTWELRTRVCECDPLSGTHFFKRGWAIIMGEKRQPRHREALALKIQHTHTNWQSAERQKGRSDAAAGVAFFSRKNPPLRPKSSSAKWREAAE